MLARRKRVVGMIGKAGMEVCCGGILGMGETLEQRAEFAAELAELDPDEVPLNFLNPRPGTPFGDLEVPLTEWLRVGPGPRPLVRITRARRRNGEPVALSEIPPPAPGQRGT